MADVAVAHDQIERTVCWCCGKDVEEPQLLRLGDHPEVGVCTRCAHWLHRRARAVADTGSRRPGALVRRTIDAARRAVVRRGIPHVPLVGPMLRWLDRHLP